MARDDYHKISELADHQWGFITTAQAERVGVDRLTLSRLEKSGQLTRMAHGVYRDSAAPPIDHATMRAAWISTEPSTFVMERSADPSIIIGGSSGAYLWGLLAEEPSPLQFHTRQRKQTQRAEIEYLQKDFSVDDIRIVDSLPVARIEFLIADMLRRKVDFAVVGAVLKAIKERMQSDPQFKADFDWEYLDRHRGTAASNAWFSMWEQSTRMLSR